jgi:hypothetical protein
MNKAVKAITYWASSQVTMGERPIFHMRVKTARAVNMSGAHIHSYSSRTSRTLKAWRGVSTSSNQREAALARADDS